MDSALAGWWVTVLLAVGWWVGVLLAVGWWVGVLLAVGLAVAFGAIALIADLTGMCA